MMNRRSSLGVAACIVAVVGGAGAEPPTDATNRLRPADGKEAIVELAPYMTEMQTLTHKLVLSLDASNPRLASFYAYELDMLQAEIQRDVPVYDGQPIAVLIDRIGKPPLERLIANLSGETPKHELDERLDSLIASCNECHTATLHGFIKITRGSGINPYAQDFSP